MRNEIFRKGLVCAILVLFIGIAIIPSIHAEVSKTNFVQEKTDNIPPVADAGGPYKGKAGEVIVLNGSDSYDPDGIIVEWYWYYFIKFGQIATLPTPIGFGETIEYSWDLNPFPFVSIYLCLRVTDNDGATDCDETNVIIKNSVSSQQSLNPVSRQSILGVKDNGADATISSSGNLNVVTSGTATNEGSLSGYVIDLEMNPIEGARVRVYFHGTYEENYSDSSGYYHVTNIPICYCLKNATASKEGYTTEWVLLSITENTTYDFILTFLSCYPVLNGTMGENGWYVSDVMITFVGDCFYVEYNLNHGNWQIYAEPILVSGDGVHTFCWYAIDSQGNTSEGCIDFKIDQTPPTINLTVEKIGFRKWLITADVYDETSGVAKVEFYVNSEYIGEVTEVPYEWIWIWSGKGGENATAIVYDNAGNSAESEVVDSISQSQLQTSNQCPQSSSNDQSIISVLPSKISEENHILVNDLVGDFNSIMKSEEQEVNVIVNGTMGENGWYISDVTITITWDPEEIAEVYYKLDDGQWTLYAEPIVISEDGLHTFYWYCVDNEGNQSAVCGFDFKIDQTPPTIELTWDRKIVDSKLVADVNDETSGVNRVKFSVNGEYVGTATKYPYEWIVSNPKKGDKGQATVYDNAGNNAVSAEIDAVSQSQSQSSSSSDQQNIPYASLFCESALGSYVDTVELGKKDDLSPGRPILDVEFLGGNRVKITNIGTATAYNVHLKLEIQGGFVLIGRVREIVIDEIEPDESVIRDLGRVFGFGHIVITVSVWADNVVKIEDSAHGMLMGFFLILVD